MQKAYEDHPSEMMTLNGKRLVISSEVPEGCFWNEARLKEVTGDALLKGRAMRQDWVDFPRTHKHLIYGNHPPQLRNIDAAIKTRFKIVPFPISFAGREDPDLPAKLWSEADYVLSWLLEGHRLWLQNGKKLPPCAAVDETSKNYFENQGSIDAWSAECCELVTKEDATGRYWPKAIVLYNSYRHWMQDRGEDPVSKTRWGNWMGSRFTKVKSDGMRYCGVMLIGQRP